MRRVSFINTEPSEREYFDEYDNYNETSLWFFMIYILRTFVPFCLALQVGPFECQESVDLYIELIDRPSFNDSIFFPITCKDYSKMESFWPVQLKEAENKNCYRDYVALRMSIIKSIGFSSGSIIGGVLSDLFGRRIITFYSAIVWNISAWILVFLTNRHFIEIWYILVVASCSVVSVVTYVTFGEIASKRTRLLSAYTIPSYVVGDYLIRHLSKVLLVWKYLLIFIAATNSIMIFACWYTPESPRWLLNKNKKEQAYKQLSEISGLVYELKRRDDAPENNISMGYGKVFWKMLSFMVRRKLKCFLIICLSMSIASLHYTFAKTKAIIHYFDKVDPTSLATAAEGIGYLFLLPIYIFLGKRCGLFFIFVMQTCEALMAILLPDTKTYYNVFSMITGVAGLLLIWLYFLDLFPTFLRASAMSCSFCIFGVATACSTIVFSKVLDQFHFYIAFLVAGLLGTTVLMLPPAHNQDLSNLKLT
ncbi:unnamed protein product [Tenebrio molitor]|nr:unnamed protein product [Tenebrio molitor]